LNPANLGTKGQHATSRPPKPLSGKYAWVGIVAPTFTEKNNFYSVPVEIWSITA
jgi:hypothetical protein